MESLLWQIEGIASCTHHTPEQLRLPFHTDKCSQITVHNMLMKNMVELCRSPASARFCPLISFIWKSQYILQVLTYPLSQLGGQPTQDRMCSPVNVLQQCGTDACVSDVANRDAGSWTKSLLLGFRRLIAVDVQQCITRAVFRTSLFITKPSEYIPSTYQYRLRLVCTQYVMVYTCTTWNITMASHR